MTEMPAQASLRDTDIRDVGWQWRAFAIILVEGVYRPQKLLLTLSYHKWFRLEMYTVMNTQKTQKT